MKQLTLVFCLGFLMLFNACKGGSPNDPLFAGKSQTEIEVIQRGRAVYLSQCSACHNADPSKMGVLAPEIHDSSMELLSARVIRGEYPVGYQSKMLKRGQTPTVMPAMPFLQADIPAIFAFLQAVSKAQSPSQ